MLDYDRIDVCEGIYINRTGDCHRCIICHYGTVLSKDKF